MHHVAPHVMAAPIVVQATEFSGTLTGPYSNVHVPGIGSFLSYTTSGTLSGVGSTRLRGTLFLRGGSRADRLVGALIMRNQGGSMSVNVFQTAMPGTYSAKVVRARGTDAGFKGASGDLMITLTRSVSAPFFVSGQATMAFTSG
jgi:hypothetical protein